MDTEKLSIDVLIAVAPAVFVYWLNRRHTEKQVQHQARNTHIRAIIQNIEEVDKKACRYYLLPGNSEAAHQLGIELNSDVGNIGRKVNSVGKATKNGLALKEKMVRFRKTITGGSFQSASRIAAERDSQLICAIRLATNELASALEELVTF